MHPIRSLRFFSILACVAPFAPDSETSQAPIEKLWENAGPWEARIALPAGEAADALVILVVAADEFVQAVLATPPSSSPSR